MPKLKVGVGSVAGLLALTVLVTHYLSTRDCSTPSNSSSTSKTHTRLLVLILSAPDNEARRDTIRSTWLSGFLTRPSDVRAFFAVGTSGPDSSLKQLNNEAQRHNDLLLLPGLLDSYATITKKVLQAIERLYADFEFEFLLKCDDDSFVVIDGLLKELTNWQNKGTKQELYWGYFNGRAKVKRSGPWKESNWFLCDYYLPYALGGGYVLSYNLVKFIAENADLLKLHNSEDISVGLWLAPLANIERKHDTRFDTEYRSRGCSNQYLITHKQSISDMKNMYDTFAKTENLCTQEVSNYLGYLYNWNVPPSQCCDRKPGIL
ncbi:hypothetical protein QAD02_008940 [Eretmocerus hayati]|uniref:Uncharacterized protein n=1 Tax=Eretmocerus hayati TaxID=131215 RepID=A0ACC2N961_9HYME|nr:hypothetical protein QAD02_008940 [Eretmocerus hayati]